jgi:cobalt-zinc-cadmium efflux system outer membrane protein
LEAGETFARELLMKQARAWMMTGVVLALTACAPKVEKGAGFEDVSSTVQQRLGQRVVWNQGTEGDKAAEKAVQALMRQPLGVEEAVQIALLNNTGLQATYEELGVAQAEVVQAGLLKNPMLSFDIRFPGRPHYPMDVDIEAEFVDLLLMPLRKKLAGAGFEEAKLRVTAEVIRLALETREAFYRLQGGMEGVEIRQKMAATQEAAAYAAERLHDAGNMTAPDLARWQAQRDQASLDLAAAQAQVEQQRAALGILMGTHVGQEDWRVLPGLAAAPKQEEDVKALEARAVKERLDLAVARKQVEIAARTQGYGAYWMWNGATLGVSYVREPDVAGTLGPAIKVPLPIFDQGQTQAARLSAELREAEGRYASAEALARGEVAMAYAGMTAALAQTHLYHAVVLPEKEKMVQEMKLRYDGMVVSVFDLLAAKEEELEAEMGQTNALRDYWLARTALQRAVGGRLEADKTLAPTTQAAQAAK